MRSIHKFNLTAVLLSATVISTPSSASNLPQTQSEHRASFAPTSLALTDGVKLPQLEQRDLFAPIHQAQTDIAKLPQLASVCFITDAGNCAGLENDEGWNLDNEDRCKEEGYDCTPCPGGSEAVDICPYSGNCHKSCKNTCDSAYNKSCNGADETGKGDSCNGLYKECCNLCSDYPYTDGNLPTGYVKSDSCNSCTGTKYKASCDTSYKYQCVDDGYDGNANKNGGSGASCDGKYKACNCKSGYNWNATTGTCDISCDPAYKFDCIKSSSTHISGGDGSACNGSTTNNACTCPTTYKYACTGTGYSGGSGTACDGKYKKCTCKSGYEWKNGTCTKTCDSSYMYTCTYSSSTHISGGSGTPCNGKYKACQCMSGYTWNAASGTCTANSSGPCDGKSNGANGNYYCCNNDVVGVKTSSMNFYVAMNDTGSMSYINALYSCQNYSFCSGVKGSFPSKEDFTIVYQNKSTLSNLLTSNGGTSFQSYGDYWVSPDTYYINMGNGKVTQAAASEGNTHKNVRPILSTSSSGGDSPCSGKSNGANGNYYCCNNDVVGVKTSSMNFYVAMKDIGEMNWNNAYTQSQNYSFCGNTKGTLPTKDQLVTIYNNKSSINNLLSANNGSKITSYFWYWSSSYEYTSRHYIVYMSDGDIQSGMDQNSNYVRPILSTSSSGGGSTCDSSYKYTCTYSSSTHISGGSGSSCGGKYKSCQCMSGYTWNASSGTCTANSSDPCSGKSNGANGNYYCCNNNVVGVKSNSMSFYVAMKDLGIMDLESANSKCSGYVFCGSLKGALPTNDQLVTICHNKPQLNNLLSTNGGTKITEDWYWSSTEYFGGNGNSYYTVNMPSCGNVWYFDTDSYVRPVLTSY